MAPSLRCLPLAAALLAATALATNDVAHSPAGRAGARAPAVSPQPWPTVIPQHQQQARLLLDGFNRAVVRGHDSEAKHYLAAGFRGRCGKVTSAKDSLSSILCQTPRPVGYQVFSIENSDRSGSILDAVVIYRLRNGRRQPLAFNLRRTPPGWAVTSIALLQG